MSFHFCIYSLLYFVPFFFFFHAFKLSKKKLINNVPKPANKNVIKNRTHILFLLRNNILQGAQPRSIHIQEFFLAFLFQIIRSFILCYFYNKKKPIMISFFLLFVYAFSTSEIVYSNVRFIVSTCASFTFTSFTTASATVIFDSVLSLNRPLHLQLALFHYCFCRFNIDL